MPPVKSCMRLALVAVAILAPSPLLAAGKFVLTNGTGEQILKLQLRRTGTSGWSELGPPPPPGLSLPVNFADIDCAFDFQALLAESGAVTWGAVNLCDVSRITLRNGASAGPWVDYDAP